MTPVISVIVILFAYWPFVFLILGIVWAINDKKKDQYQFDEDDELDKY